MEKKAAMGRLIVVVIVIIIIAIAGIGGYFLTLASSSTTNISTSSSSNSSSTSQDTSTFTSLIQSSSQFSSTVSLTSTSSQSASSSTSATSTLTAATPTTTTQTVSSPSTSLTCSAASTTTTSSTSTATSTTSAPPSFRPLVELFGNFTSMTVNGYGSSQNSTGSSFQYNSTSSYTVLYGPRTGATDFKVNFTTYSSPPVTGLVWMAPNGTIIAAYMSGQNSTGSTALGEAEQLSSAFPTEYFYGASIQAYLSIPGVHQINQSSLTLGPTSMTITNYGISSPTSFCNGSGILMDSKFNLQAGTVSGTTMTLVPLWADIGSFTPLKGSGVLTYSSTVKIISVTP